MGLDGDVQFGVGTELGNTVMQWGVLYGVK